MGLLIIRPKQHLPQSKIDEINKALKQIPAYIKRMQDAGMPPIITFDQSEVDVFGSLGTIGCVEGVTTQTNIGGQIVESVELRIDISDFM